MTGRRALIAIWIWTNVGTRTVETTSDAFDIAVFC
jgi:hypothetical protein